MDDLVPDEAVVARIEQAADALTEVVGITRTRKHLPGDELAELTSRLYELVGEANAAAEPDDPINAKYRARMRGEFLTTSMGIKFYPFDPKPEEVTHLDIVIGLTNENRYNGQTSKMSDPNIPRPISVAEHSIKAASIAEVLCERDGLDPELTRLTCLHTLLHDAHEAYFGDVIRPVGDRLYDVQTGQPFKACKQRCQDAILEAYGLGPIPAEADSIVAEADLLAYTCEVMTARRQPLEEDNRSLPALPPGVLDAGKIRPEAPLRDAVRKLLDSHIRRLVQLVGGVIPGPQASPMDVAEPTLDPEHALEMLARAKQVPGDRVYERLGPESSQPKDVGYMPNLARPANANDVSESSWQQQVESVGLPVPEQLVKEIRDELEDAGTSELRRKVLQEELNRLQGVTGE